MRSVLDRLGRGFHRDERGEITIVGWTVIAVIVFVGPTVIVGIGSLFEKDKPNIGGVPAPEAAYVSQPVPPDNDCARDAYTNFGLRWNDPVPGWSIPGHEPPIQGDPDYKSKLRIYKAVIIERAQDAYRLWIERDCHKPQDPIEHPSPVRSSEAPPISVSGTYLTQEDTARSNRGGDCVGRAIPPEMTFTVNGNILQVRLVDTPGSSAYTANGDYDPSSGSWSVTYPDGGRFLHGRFFVSGDKVLLSDGLMYTGDCALAFTGEKKP